MRAPKFISIEGIEGAGKSTIIKYVADLLQTENIEYTMTREPGGPPIAEQIREVLLKQYSATMDSKAELLLMFAGRVQNVEEIILPALEQGRWVVSDRYIDASYAYQGGGRGIATPHIDALVEWLVPNCLPDLTLLLDLPVELGFERVAESRDSKDRIELETLEFFQRVRATYLARAECHSQRIHLIDASKPLDDVKAQVKHSIATLLP